MSYLVLSNGTVFEGRRIGAKKDVCGTLVFNTGVVGYTETLTDPNNAGNIVVQTFPLIGNYGVCEQDAESDHCAKGYIVRELCDTPSNFRSESTLEEYLKKKGIAGLCGIDTRSLTCIIREQGEMTAVITDELPADNTCFAQYKADALTLGTAVAEFKPQGDIRYTVALIDLGVKRSLINALTARGCEVKVIPCSSAAKTVALLKPDGVVISDGSGDPEQLNGCVEEIKNIIGKVPMMGIGLGHALTALAMGGGVYRLKHGHRGGNMPVTSGGRTYITSQNHGFAVDTKGLEEVAKETFVNTNDGTNEGLEYPALGCFTVQFTPAAAGTTSTAFLYKKFLDMMGGNADA